MNFISFFVIGSIAVLCNMYNGVSILDDSQDGFGKDIVIPQNMVMEEPINPREGGFEVVEIQEDDQGNSSAVSVDPEGEKLVAMMLDKNNHGSDEIDVDMSVLSAFVGENREKLIQHLKISPKWRLVQEGEIYAIRRFAVEGKFFDSMNGYYTDIDLMDPFGDWDEDTYYQVRVILSLDGEVMSAPWKRIYSKYEVTSGAKKINVKTSDNNGFESYLVLCSPGVTLEIMEDSKQKGRVFTQAVCKQIADELRSVIEAKPMTTEVFEQNMKDSGRAVVGPDDIWIENGMQGGMYNVYATFNTKEPGYVYLKIFEATKNTPLSSDSIGPESKRVMDYSKDDKLKFLYESSITIYEGDWGDYYPARFEMWFVPDSGKPERKLLEQIFKVEGWMR